METTATAITVEDFVMRAAGGDSLGVKIVTQFAGHGDANAERDDVKCDACTDDDDDDQESVNDDRTHESTNPFSTQMV